MNISEAIEELKETWSFTTEEINHIRDLMHKVEKTCIKEIVQDFIKAAPDDVKKKVENSAIFCEHANEMPAACPCDDDCYCKSHSCKPQPKKEYRCPECGLPSDDHPTERCDMVLGRRGWRQLGVYDG